MDYFGYIFDDAFGGFDDDETQIINDFLTSENQNKYYDSEVLEIMICYYFENQQFTKANKLLQQALKLYPNNEEICFFEILFIYKKKGKEALELTERAISRYSDAHFFLFKAIILFELKDFDASEKAFEDFIKKLDENMAKTEMHYRFALFLVRSFYSYQQETDSDDENSMKCILLMKKLVADAVEHEYFEAGLAYFAEKFSFYGYTKEAKLILNKAIDENPYNIDLWKLLSEINIAAEEYEEAADAYLYRIALNDTSDKHLYFNCALCFVKGGKYKEAIEYFDLQMDKYPEELDDINFFCDILSAQGDSFMTLGNFAEAEKKFEEVLTINRNHFKSMVLLAQCYYNQTNYKKALQYVNDAINMDPDFDNFDYENLYMIVGQIFVDIAHNSKHQNEYLTSALLSYRKAMVYLNLARKMDNDYVDDMDEKIAFILYQIGKLNLMLENNADALMNLQLAFYLNDEISMINIFLIIAYMNLGLFKDGYVHYRMLSKDEIKEYEKSFPELKYYRNYKK